MPSHETGKRGRSVDWTGHVFGNLIVGKGLGCTDAYGIGAGSGAQLSQWELECSCGNTVVKTSSNLRSYFNKAEAIKRGEVVVRGDCTAMTIPVM